MRALVWLDALERRARDAGLNVEPRLGHYNNDIFAYVWSARVALPRPDRTDYYPPGGDTPLSELRESAIPLIEADCGETLRQARRTPRSSPDDIRTYTQCNRLAYVSGGSTLSRMSKALRDVAECCSHCGGVDFDGGGGWIYYNGKSEQRTTATVADKEANRASNRRAGVYERLAAQGRHVEIDPSDD